MEERTAQALCYPQPVDPETADLPETRSALSSQAQAALEPVVAMVLATAERERATPDAHAPQANPLRCLVKHREGLSVRVDMPNVTMNNATAEREFRDVVIGRKLSPGSAAI